MENIKYLKTTEHPENVNAFFICDRKKCNPCNPQCMHTRDVSHAINVEGKYKKSLVDGSMWQTALPDTRKDIVEVQ